jgi:hypothetical protein
LETSTFENPAIETTPCYAVCRKTRQGSPATVPRLPWKIMRIAMDALLLEIKTAESVFLWKYFVKVALFKAEFTSLCRGFENRV